MIKFKTFFIFLILIAFIGISSDVYSQNKKERFANKTPEEMAKKRADRINGIVNLSTTQYDQIYKLIYDFAVTAKSNREKFGTDREGFRNSMKTSRETMHNSIMSTLTDEQKSKLEEHRKTMKEKRGNKRHGKHNKPQSY